MNEEKKDKWTTHLAITTVLVAVCATLSTFKGGGYSTRSLMNQQKASDQWAYYEAKSIKSYLFDMQKENLELQYDAMKRDKSVPKEKFDDYDKRINTYKDKLKKYDKDKADISKEAKNFEIIRDESKKHSEIFGIAVIFLQVSIVFSSIAALTKKKFVWYCSMIVAVFGVFYFIDGFFLFM